MHEIVLAVFAVAGLLFLVSLLLPLAERVHVPYAVLLAAVGCALGAAAATVGDGHRLGMIGDGLAALRRLDLTADTFLFVFLPALLFETAINVDVRRLFEEVAPVLVLAVIGVVVSTVVVGVAMWAVSGTALLACLVLGAILATTDPVAVVAIFRDIGAPRRLGLLVEGESLLNDAAAIALFSLFVAMLTGGREATLSGAALEFLRDFAGGLAFGFLVGRLSFVLVPWLRDHRLAETTLTIALAYLSFVVGEHYLGVSGVVAAVSTGLVVSYEGRRRLSPSSWEALARNWEQIGFWASSLIFLFAAMLVPGLLRHAGLREVGLLAVIILAAGAARAATLYGLLPLLSALGFGQRVSNAYKLVILWGGMRGAVSLALALAVTENQTIPPEIREFVATLATGFVLFTLFVNAPTLRPLMHWLRLDQLSPAERSLRDRVVALSLSTISEDLGGVAAAHSVDEEVTVEAASRYRRHVQAVAELAEENAQIAPEQRLRPALGILIEREQEFYLAYFEARTMSRRAVLTLLSEVNRLREAAKGEGLAQYGRVAARVLRFSRYFRFCVFLHYRLRLRRPLARELADRFELTLAMRVVVRELMRFNERELRALFGAGVAEMLEAELSLRLAALNKAADALKLQYPSYARALQMQFLTLTALRLEEERYARLLSESIITPELFSDLRRGLARRRRAAETRPALDLGLGRDQLVERVALFAKLPLARRREIARLMRARLAYPGEVIVRKGERGDSMFFVSSGAVEVTGIAIPARLGTGDFFGEIALLRNLPRTADVVALGYCRLLSLSRRDLRRLLKSDRELRTQIYAIARQRLAAAAPVPAAVTAAPDAA
jgi:CPA1 family monovalent cation:H+ antiporter